LSIANNEPARCNELAKCSRCDPACSRCDPGEKRVKLENWQSMKIAGYYFAIFDFCQLQRQDARAKLLKIQA
jgi:hypothetical protein